MIAAIVAVDMNWAIGYKNNLLFYIPEDMTFFKKKTLGKTVIMGSNTYKSLPVKPLPKRDNIVISRKCKNEYQDISDSLSYCTLDYAKRLIRNTDEDIYIIGGGFIYNELIDYCDIAYITKVYKEYDADTYFPNLADKYNWKMEDCSDIKTYNGIDYQFTKYINKRRVKKFDNLYNTETPMVMLKKFGSRTENIIVDEVGLPNGFKELYCNEHWICNKKG